MNDTAERQFQHIAPLISKTPLLKIDFLYKGKPRHIFAKAEYYNLSGSIKDRVALHIMQHAYVHNRIREGDTVVEATSGNTGISFSAVCSYLRHPVIIYMPDWMSSERINLMRSYGAEVRLVSHEEGGFLGSIKKTEELAAGGGVFLPCQFSNEENVTAHYLTTGEEIVHQLAALHVKADAVVAGVGTGGTIMGIGRRLREVNPSCKVYPLEPLNSPTLSTGYKVGKHKIQGISDDFVPAILKLHETDGIVSVDDSDSITMARLLAEKLGIGVGISSGANFLGCIMAQERLQEGSHVVTVFADDNKKYLSTEYADKQALKDSHISKDVELVGVKSYRW